MKKKRLIACMLASVAVASVFALSGCSDGDEKSNTVEEQENEYCCHELDDVYFVLKQNDKDILHKGDMDILVGVRNGGLVGEKFMFDCGETLITNEPFSAYDTKPKEERFDEICEDCFDENNLGN